MHARRRSRLRSIIEAFGLVIILVLTGLLLLTRPQVCEIAEYAECAECAECPNATLLAFAFDRAWQNTWPNGAAPPPDTESEGETCWRVEAFNFSIEQQGEYRASRCVDNADNTHIRWHWTLIPAGE